MKITKAQVRFVRSLQQKKFRDEAGCFVAEGDKLISDLQGAFELELLINHENATAKDIEQASGMRTPQGSIAVFKKREEKPLSIIHYQLSITNPDGLVVVLDGIQDPGNLGTIIRTADWFGVHTIICSPDTADCYNPKVVQATMGALSRVHLYYTDLRAFLTSLPVSTPIYGTLLEGENIYAQPLAKNGVIIMGNEGNGISEPIRECVNHAIRIPSYPADAPTSESLNVAIATAITLATFRRE